MGLLTTGLDSLERAYQLAPLPEDGSPAPASNWSLAPVQIERLVKQKAWGVFAAASKAAFGRNLVFADGAMGSMRMEMTMLLVRGHSWEMGLWNQHDCQKRPSSALALAGGSV